MVGEATEMVCGLRNPGVHVGVTDARLYFLGYEEVRRLEERDVGVALQLFKLVSLLQSKSQEREIEQLAMMRDVHHMRAVKKPVTRVQRASIKVAYSALNGV